MAEKNARYWLNLVAVKLYELYFVGFDFENHGYRWLFDWDEELALEDNLKNVRAEDNAVAVFTKAGVIDSMYKDNFYRTQQIESFNDPFRGHIIWGGWEDFDPPKREYEYLRYILDLDLSKLTAFCDEHDINYKEEAVSATLEITNQIPIVHTDKKDYVLKTLQSGSPLNVIQAAYDHPDIRFDFRKLHEWTNRSFEAQKRFTDIFRKNEFSNGKELSPFVDITTDTFMLKKQVSLTPLQLVNIQKASTN